MFSALTQLLKRIFQSGKTQTESKDTNVTKKTIPATVLTDDTFEQLVLKADGPVVVDFFANWCGPCQQMLPKIDQLAGEYDGKLLVTKIDTDLHKRYARQFAVKQIPNIVYFNKGKIVHRTTGNLKIETLRADFNDLLKKSASAKD